MVARSLCVAFRVMAVAQEGLGAVLTQQRAEIQAKYDRLLDSIRGEHKSQLMAAESRINTLTETLEQLKKEKKESDARASQQKSMLQPPTTGDVVLDRALNKQSTFDNKAEHYEGWTFKLRSVLATHCAATADLMGHVEMDPQADTV